jgi:hypothetical protein
MANTTNPYALLPYAKIVSSLDGIADVFANVGGMTEDFAKKLNEERTLLLAEKRRRERGGIALNRSVTIGIIRR